MINRFGKILLFFAIVLACSKDEPIAITGNISGTVTESGSSEPISGASVSLSGEVNQSTSTGSSGSFGFSNITAGSYQITVTKSGYVSQTKNVTLQAEKTASANFSLQKNLPAANPNQLELTTEENSKTIELENTRSGVINFTTQTSKEWLKVNPSTGSINQGNKLIITVSADLENVPYNTYNENLVINVGEASLSIPVKVVHTEPPYITITSPKKDEVFKMGNVMSIKWDSNLEGKVSIDLIRESEVKAEISTETENDNGGNFDWEIPALEEEYYTLRITSKENDKISNETEPFKIDKGPTVPVVTTGDAVESGINFLKVGGEIVSLGVLADQVDQYGHVYSISNEVPTVADSRTKYGVSKETKTYTSDITSLKSAETYYVRAYATNAKGTSYGDIITMTTKSGGPIVTTSDPTDITENSAKVGGNISSDGGSTITERGVFYGLTDELNSDSDAIKDSSTETGTYTVNLTGLKKGTVYYVMAYAKNSSGYGYGEVKKLNTQGDPPTVKTTEVNKVSGTQAEVTGDITNTGGEPLSSYGFVYSKDSAPTVDDSKIEVGQEGSGEFKTTLTDLSVSTKYYVRAYAINPRGTSYGEELSFTTLDGKPGVTTLGYEDVTGYSILVKGRIDDNGGEDLTSYGFAYAETANPNVDGFKLEVGKNGDGNYQGKLTGLKTETKYYIKAYATNTNGTSYGDEIEVTTTDGLPVVVTVGSRDIESDKAVLTGTITSNGGTDLTSHGFVFSKDENPTTEDNKIEVGENATGGYSGTANSLNRLTTYYFKAYATNSAGTSYGDQLSFKTTDGPYLEFKAPTSGQIVQIGNTFEIKWETNITGSTAKIEHINSSGTTVLTENKNFADQTYSWSVPSDMSKSTDNKIKITNSANTEQAYESGTFTLDKVIYVPDDNFEQALIDKGYDDVLDNYVLTENISGLETLEINPDDSSKRISDPTGIEAFVSLKTLDLSKNNIESIDLSSNTLLESIKIGKNTSWNNKAIKSITLPETESLKVLNLSLHEMSSIDLSKNPNLEDLNLTASESSSTDLSNIDLSNNKNLKILRLGWNSITSLSFSELTSLQELYIQHNKLQDIDVSMLDELSSANFKGNPAGCILVSQSQLSNIPSGWSKDDDQVYTTDCSKTYVPDDNFEQALIDLGYDTKLDDYVLKANIKEVLQLQIDNLEIETLEGIQDFESLNTLIAPGNEFISVDLSALKNLNSLQLQLNYNLNSLILPTSADNLEILQLSYTGLESLDITNCNNLKKIDIKESKQLKSLDVTNNSKLTELRIEGTKIRHIDISKIENLEYFTFYVDFSKINDSDENYRSYLECVRVTKDFNYNRNYPSSWVNKAGTLDELESRGDVARLLCYEEYISLRYENGEIKELGQQIKFDSQGNLYVGLQKYGANDGGSIYRYNSSTDRTLVAGGNGEGTALNQISANWNFRFEFDKNEEYLYITDGRTTYNRDDWDPLRILKWRIGNSSGNLVAQMVKNDMDSNQEEFFWGGTNLALDSDDNVFFSSSQNIYRIKSGTTQIEKIISHQDIWNSDYDRIGSNGWKWHTGGLDIRGNILSTGAQYRWQATRYHILNWDISDNFKPTGYKVSKLRGLKLSSNGNSNYHFGFDYYSPLVIYEDNNGTFKYLNGTAPSGHESRTYNKSFDTTSFMSWGGGNDEMGVAIYNGYIYILDGTRILKSTTPLEL